MSTDIGQFDVERHRPGFEAWYSKQFAGGEVANMPRRSNGEYVRPQCEIAWLSWVEAKREASTESAKPLTGEAKDAARYRWLRDKSEPGICAFYLSVGSAFKGVKFARETVDEAIDAQIDAAIAHTKAHEGA